jgi:hypothetical protein
MCGLEYGYFSPKSPECLPDGSGGHIRIDRTVARPVVQSPTSTNAHDPATSERGGLSPYMAVEPWLLYIYNIIIKLLVLTVINNYPVIHFLSRK